MVYLLFIFLDKIIERNRKYYLRKKSKELTHELQNLLRYHNQEESYVSDNHGNASCTPFEQTINGNYNNIQNNECTMEVSYFRQLSK
jgi:hypothetical protein